MKNSSPCTVSRKDWRQCVIRVLNQLGKPSTVDEIYKAWKADGTCHLGGETPEATLGANLYVDVKKDTSPFVQTAPRTFGLKSASPVEAEPHPQSPKTYYECALGVLRDHADRKPMSAKEITEKALELGWLASKGKTPEASMSAMFSVDIRRQSQAEKPSVFVSKGRGKYGLREWENRSELAMLFDENERRVKEALLEKLRACDWRKIEDLVAYVFRRMGLNEVVRTSYSKDKGVDVRGVLTLKDSIKIPMAVQVKRYKKGNSVGDEVVRTLRGSLDNSIRERGVIVTLSSFTRFAVDEAADEIDLIDGNAFVDLMVDLQIGIYRDSRNILYLQDGEPPYEE